MGEKNLTPKQLIEELEMLQHRIAELEKELRDNQAFLRMIADNVGDTIRVIDLKTLSYTYANRSVSQLYGIPEGDYIGFPVGTNLEDDQKQRLLEFIKDELEHDLERDPKRSRLIELREMNQKHGDVVWTENHASFVRDANGKPTAILTITRDITDRKKKEEGLRKSAEEISDLYDNAPCGYHSLDPGGTFLRMNNTELRWLGYDRDEIIGKKKFDDLLTSESVIVFQKIFPVFKKQGWISNLEFDMIRKDGTILPVFLNATAIKDFEGNYIMSRSILFDNTERKQAEDALQESQQRLELALKGGALGFWDVDLKTGHTTINERWAEMLGYSYDEIKNAREIWLNSIHPDDRDRVLQVGRDYREGKNPDYEVECRAITKQGNVVWQSSKAMAVGQGADGSALRMVGIVIDITERKLAEEKMVALNRELDEVNKQLTLAYAWMRDNRDQLKDRLFKEEMGFIIDKDGLIEGVAERVLEYTGRQRQKILGTNMVDLLSDNCRDIFKAELSQAWKGIVSPINIEIISTAEDFKVFETIMTRFTLNSKRLLLVTLR
jgi:PAS domain S-box-containing protein